MQKYRIFFSERVVAFTDHGSWKPESGRIFLQNPRPNEIQVWLKKMDQDPVVREITVQSDDPKTSFLDFVGSMKKIEAAGGAVAFSGRVLFIHRFGRWDLPKGKMEQGESPEQTAVREVEEECGVGQLKLEVRFSDTFHIYFYEGQYVVKQTYWFGMSTPFTGTLKPQTEEGIEEVAWIEPADWGRVVFPQTYSSLLPLLEEVQFWLHPKETRKEE